MFASRRLLAECTLAVSGAGVATVTLDRPERRNALGRVLRAELEANLSACAADPAVRCVVLTSAVPKVFCAGADLKERKDMSPTEARAFVDSLRTTFSLFEDLEVPTIAAVEGSALGGGLELALAADLRVGGADAKFGVPETGLAIIPGAGGTYRLPKLLGLGRAQELAFTAQPVTTAEAHRIGLVNRAVPAGEALSAAEALALVIAKNGPVAVKAAKQAMREGFGQTREEGLAAERRGYERVLETQDRLEGLKAFAEKRKPQYRGE